MLCHGNQVATTPFVNKTINVKVKDGFGGEMHHKSDFEVLEVIVGNERISLGAVIWVKSAHSVHNWAKEEYNFKGKKIILVPESFIDFVDYPETYKIQPEGHSTEL